MKKLTLTKFEKRFLIVWCCMNLFALIVNLAPIKGDLSDPEKGGKVYFWTSGPSNDFWPFTEYTSEGWRPVKNNYSLGSRTSEGVYFGHNEIERHRSWFGIFNSYDLTEFLAYTLLAVAAVIVPKIWY